MCRYPVTETMDEFSLNLSCFLTKHEIFTLKKLFELIKRIFENGKRGFNGF